MADMQIVLAWAEKTALVPTGRHVMRDRNWFPEFRAEWEGRAAMWKLDGAPRDLEKARAHAATEGREVYVFPPTETDPLGKAREAAVKSAINIHNREGRDG